MLQRIQVHGEPEHEHRTQDRPDRHAPRRGDELEPPQRKQAAACREQQHAPSQRDAQVADSDQHEPEGDDRDAVEPAERDDDRRERQCDEERLAQAQRQLRMDDEAARREQHHVEERPAFEPEAIHDEQREHELQQQEGDAP